MTIPDGKLRGSSLDFAPIFRIPPSLGFLLRPLRLGGDIYSAAFQYLN
jgi:hypothetical protein